MSSKRKTPKKSAYAAAGVNREAGDHLVDRIKKMTGARKKDPKVVSRVGGYASLYEMNLGGKIPGQGTKKPKNEKRYIAASTDGVGTKLRLAFDYDSHETVGIDLVAMSVNDLLCVGATPSFFLDYFATGKLKPALAERVISGIVAGCDQAQCALVGGETAEMPSFYAEGEYDLAGFAVGQVSESELIPGKIEAGDILIGIGSSGFHSNGYSLIRKLFAEWKPSKFSPKWAKNKTSLARELLTPTRIYVDALLPLLKSKKIKGAAHITGSGFLNVPRLSEEVSYEIVLPPLHERAKSYTWLFQDLGPNLKGTPSELAFEELSQTFNLGIGMVLAVSPKNSAAVLKQLQKSGETAWILGKATVKKKGTPSRVLVTSEEGTAWLTY
jgi:phosphoribosylformylglycinamidine cyclo-ligase